MTDKEEETRVTALDCPRLEVLASLYQRREALRKQMGETLKHSLRDRAAGNLRSRDIAAVQDPIGNRRRHAADNYRDCEKHVRTPLGPRGYLPRDEHEALYIQITGRVPGEDFEDSYYGWRGEYTGSTTSAADYAYERMMELVTADTETSREFAGEERFREAVAARTVPPEDGFVFHCALFDNVLSVISGCLTAAACFITGHTISVSLGADLVSTLWLAAFFGAGRWLAGVNARNRE